MVETKKVPVSEGRSDEENRAKQSRGDFIHGANWAFKWMREHNPSTYKSYGALGSIQVIYPQHDYIVQAARERFPYKETRRRVFGLVVGPGSQKVYLKVDEGGARQVLAYRDEACLLRAPMPALTITVVRAVADLLERPDEEVDL